MKRYSKLRHEMELLDLKHKHEFEILRMNHVAERDALANTCVHTYGDGSSAKKNSGGQFNQYSYCEICNKGL